MTRRRIQTPSRLHFGLFGWGPLAARQFGGVGLMIERPGLEMLVEPADRWAADGPLADRALAIAAEVSTRLFEEGHPTSPARISILQAPEAHIGLGVGTQLSLAVARALTEQAGIANASVATLARLTGRGRRSGIGVHGFVEGGLIVDAGRRLALALPTRLLRATLPDHWSLLIVIPTHSAGLSGPDEVRAFDSLPPPTSSATDRLCRLVLLGLLPSLVESDLDSFGQTLMEMQEVVGNAFAPVQGGRFASPETESFMARMLSLGLTGIGQSSWGPTLYAFSDRDLITRTTIRDALAHDFQLSSAQIFWTRASASGATCSME